MSDENVIRAALQNILSQGERLKDQLSSFDDDPKTFKEFVDGVYPDYEWSTHHLVLADLLEKVARHEITRLMVSMPPRHGKSTTISQLFPAYYLRVHPTRKVGVTSYGAELAYKMSRAARGFYEASGGVLDPAARAIKLWKTLQNGELWASGARGPITGSGFNLGIIDDPFKDEKEAASQRMRDEVFDWYNSTFFTRKEKPEAIVLVFTRWHEDDLQGRLIEQEWTRSKPEGWTICRFEAIKTEDSLIRVRPEDRKNDEYNNKEHLLVPMSINLVMDDRKEGKALWPTMYDLETLESTRDQLGGENGFEWLSLYQQTPRARKGSFFPTGKLEVVDSLPGGGSYHFVRGWDLAGTENSGDYTAGCLIAKDTKNGTYYVIDVERFRFSSGRRDARIRWVAEQDRKKYGHVHHDFEQEPAGSGKTQQAAIVRLLSGFAVTGSVKVTDTETYSTPFRSQIEYGNVRLVRGNWNKDYLVEMSAFPKGRNDDQVIGSTRAFNKVEEFKSIQIGFINVPTDIGADQARKMNILSGAATGLARRNS